MMEGGKREREEGGEQPTSGRPLPLLPADCWRALKGCRNPDIHSNPTHEDSQSAADQLIFSLPVVISNPDNGETQQSDSRRSNSCLIGVVCIKALPAFSWKPSSFAAEVNCKTGSRSGK